MEEFPYHRSEGDRAEIGREEMVTFLVYRDDICVRHDDGGPVSGGVSLNKEARK